MEIEKITTKRHKWKSTLVFQLFVNYNCASDLSQAMLAEITQQERIDSYYLYVVS